MTHTPIDCRSAMRELWDYLDDELPADRTAQIRMHLSDCTGCQDHVQFCRAFLAQVDLPSVTSDALSVLRERVHAALRREQLSVVRHAGPT